MILSTHTLTRIGRLSLFVGILAVSAGTQAKAEYLFSVTFKQNGQDVTTLVKNVNYVISGTVTWGLFQSQPTRVLVVVKQGDGTTVHHRNYLENPGTADGQLTRDPSSRKVTWHGTTDMPSIVNFSSAGLCDVTVTAYRESTILGSYERTYNVAESGGGPGDP